MLSVVWVEFIYCVLVREFCVCVFLICVLVRFVFVVGSVLMFWCRGGFVVFCLLLELNFVSFNEIFFELICFEVRICGI